MDIVSDSLVEKAIIEYVKVKEKEKLQVLGSKWQEEIIYSDTTTYQWFRLAEGGKLAD